MIRPDGSRVEPCACGGELVVFHPDNLEELVAVVRYHQSVTAEHRQYRRRRRLEGEPAELIGVLAITAQGGPPLRAALVLEPIEPALIRPRVAAARHAAVMAARR